MERDSGFNFKLLVPPRVNSGQISAVRPQEMVDNSLHKGICKPGKLYSKLFDEVEKIKCWKVKVDSETVQKERRLQENKRTIETQRKAIQELQFGNESLSIKLEDQISENEDLKLKNNATRNLCNILKDTFQRSAEKIHIFESEREETHCVSTENREHIQRMISAFESLRVQAESDRHEMQKVKETLLQFEDLKDSLEKGYNLKHEEVMMLQQKMKDKESELQKLLGNLHETQESYKALQEAERRAAFATELEQNKEENAKMILSKDNNLQELNQIKAQQAEELVEIQATVQDLEASLAAEIKLANELELKLTSITEELEMKNTELGELKGQTEKKDRQIQILEDELNKVEIMAAENNLLGKACERAEKENSDSKDSSHTKVQMMEGQLSAAIKKNETASQETEQLKSDILQHKENVNSLTTKILEQVQETENSKKNFDESSKNLQEEITKKEKHIKTVETKNKLLKKQMTKEIEKSSELEDEINKLKKESQNLQQLNEEECQKLNDNLGAKSTSETKLQSEVQKLQLQCAEAIKSKEDAELKCQHKIADMVVLMEKHKNQYEKMVEDKDVELEEKKKQKQETEASTTSLELELSKNKIENDRLKGQLQKETTEREIKELNKEMLSLKVTPQLEAPVKKPLESNTKEISCSGTETPKAASIKRHVFEFCKVKKTPSHSKKRIPASTPKETESEALKSPSWSTTMRLGQTPKIKSYRIRTPPANEKSLPWSRTPLELDPKSDSSEHNDLLTFADSLEPFNSSYASASVSKQQKGDLFKRIQSPAVLKSPGNALKLAAMKRMRDAGWTAVTSSDKKKKKATEKIFA
ncbi:synaptonemal complex protein 1 [Aplochiton taeniatus]